MFVPTVSPLPLKGSSSTPSHPALFPVLPLLSPPPLPRLHRVRGGTDMKYLYGTRTERRRKRKNEKREKKEPRVKGLKKKEDTLRRAGRKLRGKERRIKERERGHEERRFSMPGWRRLDFISSCRFDVPDACRWPASAFLTNSSPRRPLISALRPVPVPIFISLPLYRALVYLTTRRRKRVSVSIPVRRSRRIVVEYLKMAAVLYAIPMAAGCDKSDVLYVSNPIPPRVKPRNII